MKKNILLLFVTIVLLASCDSGSSGTTDNTVVTQNTWSLSGNIDFSGCYSAEDAEVKFAAFYAGTGAVSAAAGDPCVSNIVNLGNGTTETTISFTLNLDASSITAEEGGSIMLTVWQDDNGDNVFNDTTSWVVKVDDNDSVFGEAWSASFDYYSGSWYINKGFSIDDVEITSSNFTFTGAELNDGGYTW